MGGRPTNNSFFSADNISPEVPARDEAGSFELPVHHCRDFFVGLFLSSRSQSTLSFVGFRGFLCEFKKQLFETPRFREHYKGQSRVRDP